VVHEAENDPEEHMTDAEYERDFHLERVEERNFVGGRLPHLTTTGDTQQRNLNCRPHK